MCPEHLYPLLMLYMKNMQNEAIELYLHPLCAKFLQARECSYDDLSSLNEDEFAEFKMLFKKHKSKSHRMCSDQIEVLYDFLLDLLAHKPLNVTSTVKQELLQNKVRLVPPPEDITDEAYEEEVEQENDEGEVITSTVEHKVNTTHSSIVYIKVG